MATRTQARAMVISILYAHDVGNENAIDSAKELLEEKRIRNKQQEFALTLLHGVVEQKNALDNIISAHLKEWDIHRLGKIELAILRLGVYEICFEDTDAAVAINEAIEFSKSYADESAPKLINGVLDSVQRSVKDKDLQEYLKELEALPKQQSTKLNQSLKKYQAKPLRPKSHRLQRKSKQKSY